MDQTLAAALTREFGDEGKNMCGMFLPGSDSNIQVREAISTPSFATTSQPDKGLMVIDKQNNIHFVQTKPCVYQPFAADIAKKIAEICEVALRNLKKLWDEKCSEPVLAFLKSEPVDYVGRSIECLVLGNFTDEVTLLGVGGQVGLGLVGVDLPCDIRDICGDIYNISQADKFEWSLVGSLALDVIGVIPVVGALKYLDEAGVLIKNADKIKYVDETAEVLSDGSKAVEKGQDAIEGVQEIEKGITGGSCSIKSILKETTCNSDELCNYISKNVGDDAADLYLKTGKWPEGLQVPKNNTVLNVDGSINWSKAPEGGYVLDASGNAVKESFTPKVGEIIDRYGPTNGRYTSPVIDGKTYSYTERSLPYVEDAASYYQYEVVGDFTKIEEYVNNCTDVRLKTQIDISVKKYYKGDYSRLVSYKGETALVDGWGTGGATQYEFSLSVEQLEGIGLLKKIK